MFLQKLYFWSKKIHKIVMWGVVVLGLWMMFSGYLMHKELEGEAWLSPQPMLFLRFWHNKVSSYFLVVLLIQMVTGLLIWGVPKMLGSKPIKPVVQP